MDVEARIGCVNARALAAHGRDRDPEAIKSGLRQPTVLAMVARMKAPARHAQANQSPPGITPRPVASEAMPYATALCHRLDTAMDRTHAQIHALVEDHGDHAVNLIDPEGRILTWNEGARRIYNLTCSQTLGSYYSVLFSPEQVAQGVPERLLAEASQTGESSRFERWRDAADGASMWAETHLRSARSPSGELAGFTVVLRDLTAYKRAQGELRESNRRLADMESQFRLLAECATDCAMYMLDPDGRVVTWNAGAERSHGYTAEEILGRDYSVFSTPEARETGLPEKDLKFAAENGRFETEAWQIRKDGERFRARVTLAAIRGSKGELHGFAQVTRDLTAQNLLEHTQARLAAELEQQVAARTSEIASTVEELRARNEEIESLVAVISDDLREKQVLLREVHHRVKNNMQVVQSLLRMGARTVRAHDARTAIQTAVQRVHVMAMVHEHLYQMPDLSGLTLAAYLRDVVEGAIASYSHDADQVRLELQMDEIPMAMDFAIPLGLLANELVSNSLKHGFSGGRRGTILIAALNVPGAVRFSVEDNGAGLPPDFDAAKSASMGLRLAASLAHQLGGALQFSSKNGCRVQADLSRLGSSDKVSDKAPDKGVRPVQPGMAAMTGARKNTAREPTNGLASFNHTA